MAYGKARSFCLRAEPGRGPGRGPRVGYGIEVTDLNLLGFCAQMFSQ